MDQRYNIFKIGKRYRVKRNLQDILGHFTKDEIVVSTAWGFIPYAGAYGYDFHSENDTIDAKDKSWRLYADEPPDKWHEYFEAID